MAEEILVEHVQIHSERGETLVATVHVVTVTGLIQILQSLPEHLKHWPVVISQDPEGNGYRYFDNVELINLDYVTDLDGDHDRKPDNAVCIWPGYGDPA